MSNRHIEYFSADSWEKLGGVINREVKENHWNIINVIPLHKSPDIGIIVWYEAYVIVEDVI